MQIRNVSRVKLKLRYENKKGTCRLNNNLTYGNTQVVDNIANCKLS